MYFVIIYATINSSGSVSSHRAVAARVGPTLKHTVGMPDDHPGMTDGFIVRADDLDIVAALAQPAHYAGIEA